MCAASRTFRPEDGAAPAPRRAEGLVLCVVPGRRGGQGAKGRPGNQLGAALPGGPFPRSGAPQGDAPGVPQGHQDRSGESMELESSTISIYTAWKRGKLY